MRIKPFNALRPPLTESDAVASPPYDVLSIAEAREMVKGNPKSFLHITLPAIDLPDEAADDAAVLYDQAASTLKQFQEKGYLVADAEPALYLYRLIMGDHCQRGVVAVSHTGDYDASLIKKHEKTREAPEKDRTQHIEALNAQTGPVFLTYRADEQIDALLADIEKGASLYDFTAPDGVQHAVWAIPEPQRVVDLFEAIPVDYIADGHHRAAAAARVARERRAANPKAAEGQEADWFLTVLFPAEQLKVLAYNRCVADLNGLSKEEFVARVEGQGFTVEASGEELPEKAGTACMYLDGAWYTLSWPAVESDSPVDCMDVSVLQGKLLDPILGIDDPRKNARISFVGGIRGTEELKKRVDEGRDAVVFSMFPTSIQELMAASDADQMMPPKSTWFEPKLRSGLFVHTL